MDCPESGGKSFGQMRVSLICLEQIDESMFVAELEKDTLKTVSFLLLNMVAEI